LGLYFEVSTIATLDPVRTFFELGVSMDTLELTLDPPTIYGNQ